MRYKKKLERAWEGGRTMAVAGHDCDLWYMDQYLQAAFDGGYRSVYKAKSPAVVNTVDDPLDLAAFTAYRQATTAT